jgi:hypothetical protein
MKEGIMSLIRRTFVSLAAMAAVLVSVGAAEAGRTTKLINPFDIGSAPSLPWTSDGPSLPWGNDWTQGRPDYNLDNLIADTERLLTPATPIIVRFETLRRAVLYASADRGRAKQLVVHFGARATDAKRSGSADHLAQLDAAFVADAMWQLAQHTNPPFARQSVEVHGLVAEPTGYQRMTGLRLARPNDTQVEFALALLGGLTQCDSPAFIAHATRARESAAADALLARNLKNIYADRPLTRS